MSNVQIHENVSLAPHTTLGIGGYAKYFSIPHSLEDLTAIHEVCTEKNLSAVFMGLGSNLLVADAPIDCFVIKTTKLGLDHFAIDESARVLSVGAGWPNSSILRKLSRAGWGGLEFLAGIPGTLGGAVFMNAGTKLGETSERLISASVFDFRLGAAREILTPELKFSYRKSHFLRPLDLVIETRWKIERDSSGKGEDRINEMLQHRKAKQPIEAKSCGSVFKNPPEMPAWQAIQTVGLQGHRIGGAVISPQHANWILNVGRANANDAIALIELCRKKCSEELGITLVPEVRFLGPKGFENVFRISSESLEEENR